MKDVNVTMLRQNLPEYLAQVEAGETIRVTVHGRAIAEITQPSVAGSDAETARARLRGSLVRYDDPFAPAVPAGDWDVNA